MFVITEEWLRAFPHRKPSGWTAKQLRIIGQKWPPPSGWLKRIVGRAISDEAKMLFEKEHVPKNDFYPFELAESIRELKKAISMINSLAVKADELIKNIEAEMEKARP